MEEVALNEAESRYFSDLFVCCDVEKTGKIPVLKATELFRSANLSNDTIRQITSIAGIPQTALYISRSQFYSCLKLIAAFQASISPLRAELISSSISLPLPRFSWKEDGPSVMPPRRQSSIEKQNSSNIVASNSNNINNILVSSTNSSISGTGSLTSSLVMEPNGLAMNNTEAKGKQRRGSRSPTIDELKRNSLIASVGSEMLPQPPSASELFSTDSEVEHNDTGGRRNPRQHCGSPEAWSTNSDSPTPTNSVAERPWVKETSLWQGLLGDEHRQLLGTEEESSDKHSSDEDNETELETIFQISNEQREYYHKQFKAIQPDPNGLVSGHIARVFFEKSKIPVEELRHIWQLCDVTRDGALSLAEFTSAMHLVVLRRNNIPLPNVLPQCLHPINLSSHNSHPEPPEADLLHLDDDDTNSAKIVTLTDGSSVSRVKQKDGKNEPTVFQRKHSIEKDKLKLISIASASQVTNKSHSEKPKNKTSPQFKTTPTTTPPPEPKSPVHLRTKEISKEWSNQNKEWTKFTESPTSNVSSPGPKPVNFDMQRTAQAVVSDPQILHPVPLRVTPVVGPEPNEEDLSASRILRKAENFVYDPTSGCVRETESSPKQQQSHQHHRDSHHRDSMQSNDLRAIQRPQPKKLPNKGAGAIPPPPQREPSVGSSSAISSAGGGGDTVVYDGNSGSSVASSSTVNTTSNIINNNQMPLQNKKDPPPLPPPRPRHTRSSSLDLNKLKLSGNHPTQPEMLQQASFDMQTDTTTGFADFAHFPQESNKMVISEKLSKSYIGHDVPGSSNTNTTPAPSAGTPFVQSIPASIPPPPRPNIPSLQTSQRVSAFEVYRKPNTPRNSQSPSESQQLLLQQQYYQQQYQSLPVGTNSLQQSNQFGNAVNVIVGPSVASALSVSGQNLALTNSSNSTVSINTATTGLTQNQNSNDYEKRVLAISEQLRHVSLLNSNSALNSSNLSNKLDKSVIDILRHLREQNILLLRLCNDLSQELLVIQERKEEARCKLENLNSTAVIAVGSSLASGTASTSNIIGCTPNNSINTVTAVGISGSGSAGCGSGSGGGSGNISTNLTGGSASSAGTHSNV